jgi:hypothetical protein
MTRLAALITGAIAEGAAGGHLVPIALRGRDGSSQAECGDVN